LVSLIIVDISLDEMTIASWLPPPLSEDSCTGEENVFPVCVVFWLKTAVFLLKIDVV